MTRISVVTLSLNQGNYLRQSILSVLQQSHLDLELIIVDAGSDDSSRNIAEEFALKDPRVRLIFEQDAGPSDGLNKGFAIATGEIIGCLNADDFYLPNILIQVAKEFASHADTDCIYSHGMILKNGKFKFQSSDKFDLKRYFSNRGLVLQQSTFFRLSKIRSEGISFNVANRTSWDGEFLVDLARSGGKFRRVFGAWGVFRIYEESITGSGRFHHQAQIDHNRMLKVQVSIGLKMSFPEKLFYRLKVYSLYRRLRNVLIHQILSLFSKEDLPVTDDHSCHRK